MKKIGTYVAVAIAVIVVVAFVWLYQADYLEFEKPAIKLGQDIVAVGKSKDVQINFSDADSGLSYMKVEIVQNNKAHLLAEETVPSRGLRQKELQLKVDTSDLQLKNGPASFQITARDASLFKNEAVWIQQITIDMVPPNIELLSTITYINQGGTGFIAYRTSKPAAFTGVYVDDHFSQGHTLFINKRPVCVTYFAMPMNSHGGNTKVNVYARDEAGNEVKVYLPCDIKIKKFRSDKLNLSKSFLQRKMPEFQAIVPKLQNMPLEDVFTYVNTQMRKDNAKTIQKICSVSTNKKLWNGPFHRMQHAKPMALFGDYRIYMIDRKPSGKSVHLGIDLASVAQAPIEASNAGIVVFADFLGIYGNTVIIDHGLGLFSLYAHLSSIETSVGKTVKKAEKIGRSGLTGLAGGDHLHFSILVNGQFVNPAEWWDAHWIRDNIDKKM